MATFVSGLRMPLIAKVSLLSFLTHIPHVILQYANSDEIGDRRQLFLDAN